MCQGIGMTHEHSRNSFKYKIILNKFSSRYQTRSILNLRPYEADGSIILTTALYLRSRSLPAGPTNRGLDGYTAELIPSTCLD